MLGEDLGVIFGDAVLGDHTLAALGGLFRQERAPGGDCRLVQLHGNEVRLREISIVVGVFLGAHGGGFHRFGIPAARFLHNRDGMRHAFALAARLVFKRRVNAAEGVHVLDFHLRAELLRAARTDGDVHIAAHVAFFEIAVRYSGVDEHLLERGQVGDRFVGAGHIRLGDNFHERRAAAVEVHPGRGRVVVDLGRVLLEMDVVDADKLARAIRKSDFHAAANAQRRAVLRNLVVLCHVRIEVVLPVECGVAVNLAPKHHPAHASELYRLLVHHRQCPGIAQTHRADVSVRLAAGLQQAAAKHLRGRFELHVRFQSYGILEVHGG